MFYLFKITNIVLRRLCRPVFLIFLALICWTTLAGCSEGKRVVVSTNIEVKIIDGNYEPSEWIVPSGQEITIKITNEDSTLHDWTLLSKYTKFPLDTGNLPPLIFQQQIAPKTTISAHFKAPAAPGEYQVICTLSANNEKGMIGTLLVVVPEK
jgi:plastocyanin